MRIVINEKLIKRNKKIGQYTTIGSLVILAGGLILSFQTNDTSMFSYSLIALIVGFLLSQVGIYYGNRWGRTPRPDEKITASLKGLEDRFTLYHYKSVVPHLLVGPTGVWVLAPYNQGGIILFDEKSNHWKQKGGNLYLKIFAQESLGRPDLEIKGYVEAMEKFLKSQFPESTPPPVLPVLVFYNPKVSVQAPDAPVPTLSVEKLKEFVRRKSKDRVLLSDATLQQLVDSLPQD
jgi:hypothetical protein